MSLLFVYLSLETGLLWSCVSNPFPPFSVFFFSVNVTISSTLCLGDMKVHIFRLPQF